MCTMVNEEEEENEAKEEDEPQSMYRSVQYDLLINFRKNRSIIHLFVVISRFIITSEVVN